ncbi:MAG: LicD family protein, partial [Clostridia bacterium]|nr:LicD family protein [Clostridia bacterium]
WFGRLFITEKAKYKPLIKLDKLARELPFDDAPYCATIVAGGMKNCVPTKYLSEYKLHKFERLMVNIPVGYDEYLRKLYSHINNGDYMQLPPIEKRVKHDNEAYFLDKSED